jgi:hypothetical protein
MATGFFSAPIMRSWRDSFRVWLLRIPVSPHQTLRDELEAGKYDGLIYKKIRWLQAKLPAHAFDAAELYQEFVLVAMQAIAAYDPNKGTKFSTYLTAWLRNAAAAYQSRTWNRTIGTKRLRHSRLDALDAHTATDKALCVYGVAERQAAARDTIAALPEAAQAIAAKLVPVAESLTGPRGLTRAAKVEGVRRRVLQKLARQLEAQERRFSGRLA